MTKYGCHSEEHPPVFLGARLPPRYSEGFPLPVILRSNSLCVIPNAVRNLGCLLTRQLIVVMDWPSEGYLRFLAPLGMTGGELGMTKYGCHSEEHPPSLWARASRPVIRRVLPLPSF